jgi:hypothetical protein
MTTEAATAAPAADAATVKNSYTKKSTTPSHIAKAKFIDIYEHLPNDHISQLARTYSSRLHQLRLQREHRRQTHERLTRTKNPQIPNSCILHFELGATPQAKKLPAYDELHRQVESTLQKNQMELASYIAQLQVLEMQVKEEEIAHTFCEGAYKIAMGLVNHHRIKSKLARNMQSQKLADRLVELLLDRHPDVLEHSHLQELVSTATDAQVDANKNKIQLEERYYKFMERPRPTHSRQQNRNQPSSPYNPQHTEFLTSILEEFKDIVEPCFHSLWKEYLKAKEERVTAAAADSVGKQQQEQEQHEPKENSNQEKNDDKENKSKEKAQNAATTSGTESSNNKVATTLPSAEELKALVQAAVSQETEALRQTILNLEQKLQSQHGEASKKNERVAAVAGNYVKDGDKNENEASNKNINSRQRGRSNQKNNSSKADKKEDTATDDKKKEAENKDPEQDNKEESTNGENNDDSAPKEGTGSDGGGDTSAKGARNRRNRNRNNKSGGEETRNEETSDATAGDEKKQASKSKESEGTAADARKQDDKVNNTQQEGNRAAGDASSAGNKRNRNRRRGKGKAATGNREDSDKPQNTGGNDA